MRSDRFLKELDQRLWKMDLDSYWRWKRFYESIKGKRYHEEMEARTLNRMKELQAKWPKHKME